MISEAIINDIELFESLSGETLKVAARIKHKTVGVSTPAYFSSENAVWADVYEYEGLYKVSNTGEVKSSHRKGRILKQGITGRNYKLVILCKNGKTKPFKVHRLVAKAFIQNPDYKPEVNHKDGDTKNNKFTNLIWATGRENIDHAIENNLVARVSGSKNGKSQKVIDTISGKIYDTVQEAANANNTSRQQLTHSLSGRRKNKTSLKYYNA